MIGARGGTVCRGAGSAALFVAAGGREGRMMDVSEAIEEYRGIVTAPDRKAETRAMVARYGPMFHPDNLSQLTREGFKSFLLFKNNKHWTGINRQSNMITTDMGKLREALGILLDESRAIGDRLEEVFPKGQPNLIKGLGRAVATPILAVAYPDKYGVYNSRIEQGLKTLGLHPIFHGESFARRYAEINGILNDLSQRYNLTLLELDEIFGWMADAETGDGGEGEGGTLQVGGQSVESLARFGVEEHLEEFLVFNWEKTPLGARYDLLVEDGDIVGQQYRTPVGRVDILAREKGTGNWLIVELKKGASSDVVVGQVLRYIGWVQEHLAEEPECVNGMIIAGEVDEKLKYALKALPHVDLQTYVVSFQLTNVD
jgi:hypothetical protein